MKRIKIIGLGVLTAIKKIDNNCTITFLYAVGHNTDYQKYLSESNKW